ncbi:hypothetical protein BDV10DRAFT_34560 [Aspergillus recurvatus]
MGWLGFVYDLHEEAGRIAHGLGQGTTDSFGSPSKPIPSFSSPLLAIIIFPSYLQKIFYIISVCLG